MGGWGLAHVVDQLDDLLINLAYFTPVGLRPLGGQRPPAPEGFLI
jgi:hypothetical protein